MSVSLESPLPSVPPPPLPQEPQQTTQEPLIQQRRPQLPFDLDEDSSDEDARSEMDEDSVTVGSIASCMSVASLVPPPAGSGDAPPQYSSRKGAEKIQDKGQGNKANGEETSSALNGGNNRSRPHMSEAQLVALEVAVSMYPVKGDYINANDRWRKIAAQVPGKWSKKQCYDAYKHLIISRKSARLRERQHEVADMAERVKRTDNNVDHNISRHDSIAKCKGGAGSVASSAVDLDTGGDFGNGANQEIGSITVRKVTDSVIDVGLVSPSMDSIPSLPSANATPEKVNELPIIVDGTTSSSEKNGTEGPGKEFFYSSNVKMISGSSTISLDLKAVSLSPVNDEVVQLSEMVEPLKDDKNRRCSPEHSASPTTILRHQSTGDKHKNSFVLESLDIENFDED